MIKLVSRSVSFIKHSITTHLVWQWECNLSQPVISTCYFVISSAPSTLPQSQLGASTCFKHSYPLLCACRVLTAEWGWEEPTTRANFVFSLLLHMSNRYYPKILLYSVGQKQVYSCEYASQLIIFFIYCIPFHPNNRKPTFAPPCTYFTNRFVLSLSKLTLSHLYFSLQISSTFSYNWIFPLADKHSLFPSIFKQIKPSRTSHALLLHLTPPRKLLTLFFTFQLTPIDPCQVLVICSPQTALVQVARHPHFAKSAVTVLCYLERSVSGPSHLLHTCLFLASLTACSSSFSPLVPLNS